MFKAKQNNHRFIVLPENPIEGVFILFNLLLKKGNFFYGPPQRAYVLRLQKIPLIGNLIKNKLSAHQKYVGDCKGLWYEINKSVTLITNEFYDKNLSRIVLPINYLNKKFKTSKFEAFTKKRISNHIFQVLKILYLAKNTGKKSRVFLKADPINLFVVNRFNQQHRTQIKADFSKSFTNLFFLFTYWAWLIKELLRRGFAWRKKRPYFKLSMQAGATYYNKTLRDDMIIDGKHFTKDDFLFLLRSVGESKRSVGFNVAKEEGFHWTVVPKLPFNLRNNFFGLLKLYFFTPLSLYLK